jgi:hypothetical protein
MIPLENRSTVSPTSVVTLKPDQNQMIHTLKSKDNKMRKSACMMISFIIQCFCFITCLMIWKDGKVVGSAYITEINALQKEVLRLNSIIDQNKQYFMQTNSEFTLKNAQFEQRMNLSDQIQQQKNSNVTEEIFTLFEKQESISRELGFLTLDNRPTIIKSTSLGFTLQGYAIRTGLGSYRLISYLGSYLSPSYPGNGWIAKGANEEDAGGYSLYMYKRIDLLFEVWNLDENYNYASKYPIALEQALNLESRLNFDFNEDGIVRMQCFVRND